MTIIVCAYWGFREEPTMAGRTAYARFTCDLFANAEPWRGISLCKDHRTLVCSKPQPQQDALEITMRSTKGKCKHGCACPWISCSICGEQQDKLAIADPRLIQRDYVRRIPHAGGGGSGQYSGARNEKISESLREYWKMAKADGTRSPETHHMWGKHHSEETRAKIKAKRAIQAPRRKANFCSNKPIKEK
jgi:hypothetical protein